MTRGPRKHLKLLAAPVHWYLPKLGGKWAPKPSAGPHMTRECLPLVVLLRNRLKYALTRREVIQILAQRLVKVDGKVRTDTNFPAGFMDVVSIEKTKELFRLLYDSKGRFAVHRIQPEESKFKLGKVKKVALGPHGVPYLALHDGRTVRYPDPAIRVADTVKYDLEKGKIVEHYKCEVGNVAMIIGGRNLGRVGVIQQRERHLGSFDILHLADARGNPFATRATNIFVIGKGSHPAVTLPVRKGIKYSIIEEREQRLKRNVPAAATVAVTHT